MGSKEGVRKAKEAEIKKYGSLEAYRAEMSKRAKKGGKSVKNRKGFHTMDKKRRVEVAKKGGSVKKGKAIL